MIFIFFNIKSSSPVKTSSMKKVDKIYFCPFSILDLLLMSIFAKQDAEMYLDTTYKGKMTINIIETFNHFAESSWLGKCNHE